MKTCRIRHWPRRAELRPVGSPRLFSAIPPLAGRDSEPLLEGAAEVSEIVEPPCICDVADMPRRMGRIGQIALAVFETLSLDIIAEGNFFRGQQIADVARRHAERRRGAGD